MPTLLKTCCASFILNTKRVKEEVYSFDRQINWCAALPRRNVRLIKKKFLNRNNFEYYIYISYIINVLVFSLPWHFIQQTADLRPVKKMSRYLAQCEWKLSHLFVRRHFFSYFCLTSSPTPPPSLFGLLLHTIRSCAMGIKRFDWNQIFSKYKR